MYLGKSGLIRAKLLHSIKTGIILALWLYSGKVILFGQSDVFGQGGLIGQELLYSVKGGCIRGKWLYAGKVAVFG